MLQRLCRLDYARMVTLSLLLPACCLAELGHPDGSRAGASVTISEIDVPDTITLANGEWAPYQSPNLKYGGVVSRIVSAAFADQETQVKYVFLPWKRAYYTAKKGLYEGTIVWRKSARREKDFWFSDPIFTGKTVLFHLKRDHFSWRTLSDLEGKRVGATLGYDYVPLDRATQRGLIELERAATDLQNFKKLLRGRIDLFPSDLDVGLHLIQTHLSPEQAAQITWSQKPLETVAYHLMLNRKSPSSLALMSQFNRGLHHLRAFGLVKKWFRQSRHGDYRQHEHAGKRSRANCMGSACTQRAAKAVSDRYAGY